MTKNEAFDLIWTSLIDVEEYMQTGIPKQLETAVSFSGDDMVPLFKAHKVIRRLHPYLSPSVLSEANESLETAQFGLNKFLDALRDYLAIPPTEVQQQGEAIKKSNDILGQALNDFRNSLNKISALRNTEFLSPRKRNQTEHDAFISHASGDKNILVRPLAEQLEKNGFRIWYDEFEITVGDSLEIFISRGLSNSRFAILVISPSFLLKICSDDSWCKLEFDKLAAREELSSDKVILPIWYNVTKDDVAKHSPYLADKYALNADRLGINGLITELGKVLVKE